MRGKNTEQLSLLHCYGIVSVGIREDGMMDWDKKEIEKLADLPEETLTQIFSLLNNGFLKKYEYDAETKLLSLQGRKNVSGGDPFRNIACRAGAGEQETTFRGYDGIEAHFLGPGPVSDRHGLCSQ